MDKEYEVLFEVYGFVKAQSSQDAIKKFAKENNIASELLIYCTAKEVENKAPHDTQHRNNRNDKL